MSKFSHAQLDLSSNYSIGQYFDKRNEQLYEMIPNKSPKKRNRIVPLYEESLLSKTESFAYKKSPPFIDQQSQNASVLSVSTIAAQLCMK